MRQGNTDQNSDWYNCFDATIFYLMRGTKTDVFLSVRLLFQGDLVFLRNVRLGQMFGLIGTK